MWLALLSCGCSMLPLAEAFSPACLASIHSMPHSARWGDRMGSPSSAVCGDGRAERTALRLSPARGGDGGRSASPALKSIAMPQDGQGYGCSTVAAPRHETKSLPDRLEDDYGTLFRGTETLFRFCAGEVDSTRVKDIVSAGKFKEGG